MCLIGSEIAVKPALDLIGDVRDHLNSSSAEITAALFLEHRPVNLTGGHVGIFCQTFIDKTLIMS